MNLSNKELLFYGSILTMLLYIWYDAQIDIKYLFPFILFAIFFYYREEKKATKTEENINRTENIIKDLYDEKYPYLESESIVLFIDSLRPIRQFNIPIFNNFLLYLNQYYKTKKLTQLLTALDIFESMYFALTPEMTDFYNTKFKELKQMTYDVLEDEKYDRVEMQSYLPSSYIHDNIIV